MGSNRVYMSDTYSGLALSELGYLIDPKLKSLYVIEREILRFEVVVSTRRICRENLLSDTCKGRRVL